VAVAAGLVYLVLVRQALEGLTQAAAVAADRQGHLELQAQAQAVYMAAVAAELARVLARVLAAMAQCASSGPAIFANSHPQEQQTNKDTSWNTYKSKMVKHCKSQRTETSSGTVRTIAQHQNSRQTKPRSLTFTR
jgi:cell pole-organizing protein PopZ